MPVTHPDGCLHDRGRDVIGNLPRAQTNQGHAKGRAINGYSRARHGEEGFGANAMNSRGRYGRKLRLHL